MPVCKECIRATIVDRQDTHSVWSDKIGKPVMSGSDFSAIVGRAFVVDIHSNSRHQDMWCIELQLSPYGRKQYYTPQMHVTIPRVNDHHVVENKLELAEKIVRDMERWHACSTCSMSNVRGGDVMGCTTTECVNNGIRDHTMNEVARVQSDVQKYSW